MQSGMVEPTPYPHEVNKVDSFVAVRLNLEMCQILTATMPLS